MSSQKEPSFHLPIKSVEDKENIAPFHYSQPVCDLFFDAASIKNDPFFDALSHDPTYQKEVIIRQELSQHIKKVYEKIPDVTMDLDTACTQNLINSQEITQLHEKLSSFLASDPQNARMVLYLPFQFLPSLPTEENESQKDADASKEFAYIYMNCWRSILSHYDVRANFVNGDIFEPEMHAETPRVIKALHLLPELLKKNFISSSDVLSMIEITDDEILKRSLIDILPVLADEKLLSTENWRYLLFSQDPLMIDAAFITCHTLREKLSPEDSHRIIELFSQCTDTNTMLDRFHGLHTLLTQGHVAQDDIRDVHTMFVAGAHFIPMHQEIIDMCAQNAEHDPFNDTFTQMSADEATQKWISVWSQNTTTKESQKSEENKNIDLLATNEVWTKIQEHRTKIEMEKNEMQDKTPGSLQDAVNILREDIMHIAHIYADASSPTLHPARLTWQKHDEQEKAIEKFACTVSQQILQQSVTIEEIVRMISNTNPFLSKSSVLIAQKVIDQSLVTKELDMHTNLKTFVNAMHNIWHTCPVAVRDTIISTLAHWKNNDLLSEADIENFDITFPHLDRTNELLPQETEQIMTLLNDIVTDPLLSENVHPTLLAFGSRLKGYAATTADLDVALFIKSETSWNKRDDMLHVLKQKISQTPNIGEVVEYWLKDQKDHVEIRDVPLAANTVAEKDWIHTLLQSAWFGKEKETKELQHKLLSWCFDPQQKKLRVETIKQMERESLQYRLMHKGYARFYPSRLPQATEHAHLLDHNSSFWDPGYRRIATQLYITKVFFPTLSQAST